MKLLAFVWAVAGLFLICCAIIPPPFFNAVGWFERILALLVGVTAIGNALSMYFRD